MLDLKMWGKALTQMPKLSKDQWQQLDPIAKWLVACRASVLFMTFTAAALGGLMAWRDGSFHWSLFFALLVGLLFAHASNNLLNDYTDSRRGIDRQNYYRNQYGVHILEDGLVSQRQFWLYFGFTASVALLLGSWLVYQRSGLTLNLMLAGSFFVLFYTWPLKYYGLGEPAVLLVWGPLMVGGCYYVLTASWSWDVTWLSLVFALGPTSVLFGKHTDKLEDDRAKQVKTLPVILGERNARLTVTALLLGQYLLCIGLILFGSYSWPLLLVAFSLPSFIALSRIYRQAKPVKKPDKYPAAIWPLWFSAYAFKHTRIFTLLFLTAVLLDSLLVALSTRILPV